MWVFISSLCCLPSRARLQIKASLSSSVLGNMPKSTGKRKIDDKEKDKRPCCNEESRINIWELKQQSLVAFNFFGIWNLLSFVCFIQKSLLGNSTKCEGLHNTEWAGKVALIQKSIENFVRSDFYSILQQPSQTHENASTEPFSAAPEARGRCIVLPLPWSWLIDLCFEPNNFCEELKRLQEQLKEWHCSCQSQLMPMRSGGAIYVLQMGLSCSSSHCWASTETFCNSFFAATHAENDTLPGLHGELSNTFLLERHAGSNSSQIRGNSQQLSSPPATPQLQEHFHASSGVLLQRIWSALCIHPFRVQAQVQSKISADSFGSHRPQTWAWVTCPSCGWYSTMKGGNKALQSKATWWWGTTTAGRDVVKHQPNLHRGLSVSLVCSGIERVSQFLPWTQRWGHLPTADKGRGWTNVHQLF